MIYLYCCLSSTISYIWKVVVFSAPQVSQEHQKLIMQKISEIQERINDQAKHESDVKEKLSKLETKYDELSSNPAWKAGPNEDEHGDDHEPWDDDAFGDDADEDAGGSITTADGKVVPLMNV